MPGFTSLSFPNPQCHNGRLGRGCGSTQRRFVMAMSHRGRFTLLISATAVAGVSIALLSVYFLYRTALDGQVAHLLGDLSVRCRLLEATVGGIDESELRGDRAPAAVLATLRDSVRSGDSSPGKYHFCIARRENGAIICLRDNGTAPRQIPPDCGDAVPFQRAFLGERGTVLHRGCEGQEYLSAFESTVVPDVVIVGSIDLADIRRPFQSAAIAILGVALSLTLISAASLRRLGINLTKDIERRERKFRTLFEHSSDGAVLLRNEVLDCNEEACRLLGYTREELIGKRPEQFSPPTQPDGRPSKEVAQERINAAFRGEGQYFQWTHRHSEGHDVVVEVSLRSLQLEEDSVIHATLRDITQRVKTERRLRLTQFLNDRSTDAIFLFRRGGALSYVNPAACRLLGYSEAELLDLRAGELCAEFEAFIARNETEGSGFHTSEFSCQTELLDNGGEAVAVEVSMSFFDFEGESFSCAYVHDLREHRNLQAQLLQAQKLEAVGRLAGGIAHDFNNLLTIIGGYTDMLLDRHQGEAVAADRVALTEIRSASDRAADLTRQLLTFSRKQIIKPKTLNLNEVISGMDRMIRRLIGEDIEFSTILRPNLSLVRADPAQLEQVLLNLCVNARDAMPDGGKLIFETAEVDLDSSYADRKPGVKPGRYVLLAVNDTGVGMDRETQSRIFEPFYTTKGRDKGTGLGLSTVYGIVKRAGGNVWVYSELGHGTTFKVYLPQIGMETEEAPPDDKPGTELHGDETILVVEDDDRVRGLVVTELRALGYTVLSASSPNDALMLTQAQQTPIDLLLTDVVLPVISGRVLAEQLSAERPALRVLFMSGYTDSAIAQHGVLEEGVSFLQKPFSKQSLAAKVREVLSRRNV